MIARITDACIAAPMPWMKRAPINIALIGRQPAERRGGGEHDHAGEEHALAAEQIAEPAGEQQEAGECDEEGVDDPGEVSLAEVQVALDGGQRDVHDRRVEHDHQLGEADDREREPAAAVPDGDGRGGAR